MQVAFVEIQNFRKLKAIRIEFAEQETVFVGANNSGKTSAMDALILFLKRRRRKDIAITDFTLSNWAAINSLGADWIKLAGGESPNLSDEVWIPHLPAIDIWLNVNESEIHRVIHLLPTLDWKPSDLLGVRLVLAPKNLDELHKAYCEMHWASRAAEGASGNGSALNLWPSSMQEFLQRELHRYFEVQAFLLDPEQCASPESGRASPQQLPDGSEPLEQEPIDSLFKIDVITAQRGFSDPKTEGVAQNRLASLSSQLQQYFKNHLDPTDTPDASDVEALEAIELAKLAFDSRLKSSFEPALGELEGLNYPGFSDPKISLTSQVNPVDGLDHATAVQFSMPGNESLSLPEQYNGLGYQNLISMVFSLIQFRDDWIRFGKASKKQPNKNQAIEPLHLVLIEEPEAHLHAQVQQVFIKKAYQVLRNADLLKSNATFSTQMVVSTHSSRIAHELDFTCLRYFRREASSSDGIVPTASVVNLSKTFGTEDDTTRFVTRYLQATHCELFFADAAILVEGAAERMLVPHFIRLAHPKLDKSYICLLEIGGAHAHRLRPLIEALGMVTLIVTDLDSIGSEANTKTMPARGQGCRTGNTSLATWVPGKKNLDELIDLPAPQKVSLDGTVRVAYQSPITVDFGAASQEALPYTFEDALTLSNIAMFRQLDSPKGLLKKLKDALGEENLSLAQQSMFNELGTGSKAGMALELLFLQAPQGIKSPSYITEGLQWLELTIDSRRQDFVIAAKAVSGDD